MVPMPAAVVLVVCKSVLLPADQQDVNAKWTGHEAREWQYVDSMMQCRRKEIQLFDQSAAMGASSRPFTRQQCMAAGILAGVEWDQAHRSSSYRFWRVACPTPVIDTRTGEIISWVMPDCTGGKMRGKIVCEGDVAI